MNMPHVEPDTQRAMRHLQKCLTALDKIAAIAGAGPITELARRAINNQPLNAEGTALDG